jgi:hypothetical protein
MSLQLENPDEGSKHDFERFARICDDNRINEEGSLFSPPLLSPLSSGKASLEQY